MVGTREVRWADIQAAAHARDPQLADLVILYMDQPDPPEDRTEDAEDDAAVPALPQGAWTMHRLRAAVGSGALAHLTDEEQRAARAAAWDALQSAKHPPPRLQLGELLRSIYAAGDEPGRAALLSIFARAKLGWGLWQGFKRVYKLAETRHDIGMFAVLAWRLDTVPSSAMRPGEVSRGTIVYLRRRAWRWLRLLGQAVPEAYPAFATAVLRQYEPGTRFFESWIASQVWGHQQLIGLGAGGVGRPSDDPKHWAFPDAWKASPGPMLQLLEDAKADEVCRFSIIGLTKLFEATLRDVDPAWLRRLGAKPLPAVHDFVAQLLTSTPKFHPSKLAELGLHELAIDLLESPSADARKFAVAYARAHAPDLDVARLVRIAVDGQRDTYGFVSERLDKLGGKAIGLPALVQLLTVRHTHELAKKKITESFTVADLTPDDYIALATGGRDAERFVDAWYADAKREPPAAYLIALLEHPRMAGYRRRFVLDRLRRRPAREIGIAWIQDALLDPSTTDAIADWLQGGMLQGTDLDVEWAKDLVKRPKLRATLLTVLGNPKWVAPSRLGVDWLLSLLRQSDATLRTFARRYVLEHFSPADLGDGGRRVWDLLAGSGRTEPVRELAATYLRVHHPTLSATHPERRDLGITPQLSHAAYPQAIVEPLLSDPRADVRRVAAEIADEEVVRWGDASLPYRLATLRYPEPRNVGGAMLLRLGDPDVAPERALPVSWLAVDQVFSLAESPIKSTREVALTLIRRHYDRLGGARRLAWLMESPDREVRLFAVRLLWEKHRPHAASPVAQRASDPPGADERFHGPEALQTFLRTVLFALPPGRMERRVHDDALRDRALPASVAKQRLVAVISDFAIEDLDFARLVQPVLDAFVHSGARGECDACIRAVATLRHAHPDLVVELAAPIVEIRAPRRPRFGSEGGVA